MQYGFLLLPAIAAIAFYLFARLVIWNIFYPLRATRLAGFTVQGILAKQWPSIIAGISSHLSNAFTNTAKGITQKLKDPQSTQRVMPAIETHIDDFLRNKLPVQMPMIGMFIGDKTISTMKVIFLKEIEELFPQVISGYSDGIIDDLKIDEMIHQKLSMLSPESIAKQFHGRFKPLLQKFYVLVIFAGIVVGLIQWAILVLTNR